MKSYALDHPKLPPILLDLFFYLFPEFSYLFVGVLVVGVVVAKPPNLEIY